MSTLEQQTKQTSALRSISEVGDTKLNEETASSSIGTKTLFFTSSTSTTMPLTDGTHVAYTGLYKCTFSSISDNDETTIVVSENSLQGEQNVEPPQEQRLQCDETRKVANGFNRDGTPHASLPLYNLQFHNGNNQIDSNRERDQSSYLYANTHVDNSREYTNSHVQSWEILRAKLPTFHSDEVEIRDQLAFESVFRTLDAFDWNECDFRCCLYSGNADDDPFAVSKDEHNGYYAHTHAYVRTVPRSFAVDETTGDVFVSWEGFYQNCDPANLSQDEGKKLEWTIGISRVRMEDPYCTTDQVHVRENNFPRCTEPVSIVYQNSRGRDVVLPHGGFTVIPADRSHSKKSGRSFLLSTLRSATMGHGGDLTSQVWAFPEGGNPNERTWIHEHLSLNGNGTVVDDVFLNANTVDGGTLRLHTNHKTGRPDHLCRTVFNMGIGCMPISFTEEDDLVRIQPQGDEQIVLTEDQVTSFCKLQDADSTKRLNFARQTTLVTGLDIVWDEHENDGSGSPKTIVFGCYGGEGGNGNFGRIDVDPSAESQHLHHPIQVMEGAFPGAVHFVPNELEDVLKPSALAKSPPPSTLMSMSTSTLLQTPTNVLPLEITGVILMLCIFSFVFLAKRTFGKRKRRPSFNFSLEAQSSSITRVNSYVELPTVDSSAHLQDLLKTMDSYSSISSEV
eukprot:jgi/Psemu1/293611/fgenesh1_pg.2916_\